MPLQVEIRELSPQPVLTVTVKTNSDNIGDDLGKAYGTISAYLEKVNMAPAGPPFCRYLSMDGDEWLIQAGLPVAQVMVGEGDVRPGELPGGRTAVALHVGPYDGLAQSWPAFEEWMRERGYSLQGAAWESYVTDSDEEPDSSKWYTELYFHIL